MNERPRLPDEFIYGRKVASLLTLWVALVPEPSGDDWSPFPQRSRRSATPYTQMTGLREVTLYDMTLRKGVVQEGVVSATKSIELRFSKRTATKRF